jgi:hypothetical protein
MMADLYNTRQLQQICMAVFGLVISTLMRNAQRGATGSAKNTHMSIKEQTDGLYPAANGELVNYRKLHMATSRCTATYSSEPAVLISAHGRNGEYWLKAYINSASEATAVVLQC